MKVNLKRKNDNSSVLIVDDHLIAREGLKRMLEATTNYKVVGQAKDGFESIKQISNLKPDIAFIDVNLPKVNGLQVLKKIKRTESPTKIILYGNFISHSNYGKAIANKADGILLKECTWEETLSCIKTVLYGKQYISPICLKHNVPAIILDETLHRKELERLQRLTEKEMTVLKLVSEQKTTAEIAEILFRSKKTIENVRYCICRKLRISGPNSLTMFALKRSAIFS
ncbi:response regulator [Maribacter sp. 2-571]|uniref:response regulator n=1 Tax=Maribacter sp. 2-571 TaxID=3417569 RepID=UPI003D329552